MMISNIPKRKNKGDVPHYLRDLIFKYDYHFEDKEEIILSFYENVNRMVFLPNKVLAIVHKDFEASIKIWSTVDGRLITHKILDTFIHDIKTIDDNIIFTDSGSFLKMWDANMNLEILSDDTTIRDIDILDMKIAISSHKIKILDFDTRISKSIAIDNIFRKIKFLPDGRIVGYSTEGVLKIWSDDLLCLYTCNCYSSQGDYCFDVTSNVVYYTEKGEVAILNTQTYISEVILKCEPCNIQIHRNLLLLNFDEWLIVYDLKSKELRSKQFEFLIESVATLPNDQIMILLDNDELATLDSGKFKSKISIFYVLPDGRVIGVENHQFKIWI